MKVKFKKLHFGADGYRYRPGIHNVPDDWKGKLPKTATIIDELPDEEEVEELTAEETAGPKVLPKSAKVEVSKPAAAEEKQTTLKL